jgi:GH15 family glucan-1,4-alpha-glucosidase
VLLLPLRRFRSQKILVESGKSKATIIFTLADFIRNWDYRFCWVRDSSFTIYILLRMGFVEEADAYMDFISDRFRKSRSPEGALPIMFTIRGETDIPEIELR